MDKMLIFQLIFTVAACVLLFAAWRNLETESSWWNRIVTAGFAVRALAGVALFWISYLRLPIARSLQLGNGIWFIGEDAIGYYDWVDWMLADFRLFFDPDYRWASPSFLRALAVGRLLFGPSMAAGLLLNLFCYVGSLWLIRNLARRDGAVSPAGMSAAAVLSFSPATLMFSLQPLKEALFVVLFLVLLYLVLRWYSLVQSSASTAGALGCLLAAAIVFYLVSDVRWYFGAAFWGAFAVSSAPVVAHARRRLRAASLAILAVVVIFFTLLAADHTYFASFKSALTTLFGLQSTGGGAGVAVRTIQEAQVGFASVESSTTLKSGSALGTTKYGSTAAHYIAMFLPRFVFGPLYLVSTAGSRAMWLIVDAATLLFDLVLVATIVWLVRNRRPNMMTSPGFVLLATLFFALMPIVYVVNNMGTLFRHREMFLLPLALLPVAIEKLRSWQAPEVALTRRMTAADGPSEALDTASA